MILVDLSMYNMWRCLPVRPSASRVERWVEVNSRIENFETSNRFCVKSNTMIVYVLSTRTFHRHDISIPCPPQLLVRAR